MIGRKIALDMLFSRLAPSHTYMNTHRNAVKRIAMIMARTLMLQFSAF